MCVCSCIPVCVYGCGNESVHQKERLLLPLASMLRMLVAGRFSTAATVVIVAVVGDVAFVSATPVCTCMPCTLRACASQ